VGDGAVADSVAVGVDCGDSELIKVKGKRLGDEERAGRVAGLRGVYEVFNSLRTFRGAFCDFVFVE